MNKNQWITQLQLEPHVEGGYFRRTYQSDYTNLISIFRLFIQPMISKFAVSNERNSQ